MHERNQTAFIPVELKYCEACGGLWLRPAGVAEVYCARCAEIMAAIAVGKAGRYAN